MLNCSLNEIAALARKAIRGSGLAWGLADDGASCVRLLATFGLPGLDALAALSQELNSNMQEPLIEHDQSSKCLIVETTSRVLHPLRAAAIIGDRSRWLEQGGNFLCKGVEQPLLLAGGMAHLSALLEQPILAQWTDGHMIVGQVDGEVTLTAASETGGDSIAPQPFSVTISLAPSKAKTLAKNALPHHSRCEVSLTVWEKLNQLAHKTYAPASEESRLLGAGAGLADND